MNKATIFVEGVNDELFLRRLIKKVYGFDLGVTGQVGGVFVMGGNNREHFFQPKFDQSTVAGFQNLVFEDADLEKDARGLKKVKQLLVEQRQINKISFEDFIFPNDTALEGSLENILLNIVKPPKDEWLNCAKNYYDCLAKNGKVYDKKTQWDIFTGDVLKDKNLNFSDQTTWFIDNNLYLTPLITFLDKFFTKKS
jgi:hypothetical protein